MHCNGMGPHGSPWLGTRLPKTTDRFKKISPKIQNWCLTLLQAAIAKPAPYPRWLALSFSITGRHYILIPQPVLHVYSIILHAQRNLTTVFCCSPLLLPPICNVDGQCRDDDDEFFLHRPPGELGQHCIFGEGEAAATKTVVKFRCGLNEGNQVQEHVNVRYRPQLVHRVRHVSPSCR